MIDSQKIAIFDKYASAPANAFGSSPGKPSLEAESNKDVYWAIYEDLQKSCEESLDKTSYATKFYVKTINW